MAEELDKTLFLVRSGKIREHAVYRELSDELLQLRHVALSGDGEPTLCPIFAEAVQVGRPCPGAQSPFVFQTGADYHGTGLDLRPVQESLKYFTPRR